MWTHIRILLICACAVTAQIIEENGLDSKNAITDGIANFINKTLEEKIKPHLELLPIKHFNFKTGEQEFGSFNGFIDGVNITGLSDLIATIIEIKLIPLKVTNLTLEIENVNLKGTYSLNGELFFPLNNDRIPVFGDGDLEITVTQMVISAAANMHFSKCIVSIDQLVTFVDIGGLQIELKNIMGGGKLEETFNQLFNDVGLTVVNYYKESIVEGLIPYATKIVNEVFKHFPIHNPGQTCD